MSPAKYSLYELLTMVIERVPWASEQIRLDLLDTVRIAEANNVFGVVADIHNCQHENQGWKWSGQATRLWCNDCGRWM